MVSFNSEYLLKNNTPFIFDKRDKRLFQLIGDSLFELKNAITRSRIVISNAAVVTKDTAFEIALSQDSIPVENGEGATGRDFFRLA